MATGKNNASCTPRIIPLATFSRRVRSMSNDWGKSNYPIYSASILEKRNNVYSIEKEAMRLLLLKMDIFALRLLAIASDNAAHANRKRVAKKDVDYAQM